MSILFEYNNYTLGKRVASENLLISLNHFLADMSHSQNGFINVMIDGTIIDNLSCNTCQLLISKTSGKEYDLNSMSGNSITNLLCDYSNLTEPSYNTLLRQCITNRINSFSQSLPNSNFVLNKICEQQNKNTCMSSNSPTVSNSPISTKSNLLEKISIANLQLEQQINTCIPHTTQLEQHNTQQSVKFDIPANIQTSLTQPEFHITKIPDINNVCLKQNNNLETCEINTNDTNSIHYELTDDEKNMLSKMSNADIEKAIKKLSEIHEDLDKEIHDTLYDAEVIESRKMRHDKAEKKREEEKKSVFISDKTFTYQKIYADFFINTNKTGDHYIKSWDGIPELFVVKFVIFLYMDGRNNAGELVRERLLDTEQEFQIYEMLYNILTDDEYIVPDDEKLREFAEEFIDTLPPIQIITNDQIMKALNDPDDPIFNCDETSQCSGDDEYEDSKVCTYNM
jgi:hypothetical protein